MKIISKVCGQALTDFHCVDAVYLERNRFGHTGGCLIEGFIISQSWTCEGGDWTSLRTHIFRLKLARSHPQADVNHKRFGMKGV